MKAQAFAPPFTRVVKGTLRVVPEEASPHLLSIYAPDRVPSAHDGWNGLKFSLSAHDAHNAPLTGFQGKRAHLPTRLYGPLRLMDSAESCRTSLGARSDPVEVCVVEDISR